MQGQWASGPVVMSWDSTWRVVPYRGWMKWIAHGIRIPSFVPFQRQQLCSKFFFYSYSMNQWQGFKKKEQLVNWAMEFNFGPNILSVGWSTFKVIAPIATSIKLWDGNNEARKMCFTTKKKVVWAEIDWYLIDGFSYYNRPRSVGSLSSIFL